MGCSGATTIFYLKHDALLKIQEISDGVTAHDPCYLLYFSYTKLCEN